MAGDGNVKKALAADLEDEREGVRTYGRQARAFGRSPAGKTVRSIRKDEQRHVKKLQRAKKRSR